jgi:uncharacterized protein YbaA (DUF1428 family)
MTKLNANVRKDPRLARMDCSVVPFACQRMADGKFEIFVETFASPAPERVKRPS